MDDTVYAVVYPACPVSLALVMGLYLQHGSKRCRWNYRKSALEWIQLRTVSEDWADLGSLARYLRCLDHHGYELGVA